MTFIESPGQGVYDIGVEVELFFRIGNVVGYKRYAPAGACFTPNYGELLQNIPPDAV